MAVRVQASEVRSFMGTVVRRTLGYFIGVALRSPNNPVPSNAAPARDSLTWQILGAVLHHRGLLRARGCVLEPRPLGSKHQGHSAGMLCQTIGADHGDRTKAALVRYSTLAADVALPALRCFLDHLLPASSTVCALGQAQHGYTAESRQKMSTTEAVGRRTAWRCFCSDGSRGPCETGYASLASSFCWVVATYLESHTAWQAFAG